MDENVDDEMNKQLNVANAETGSDNHIHKSPYKHKLPDIAKV